MYYLTCAETTWLCTYLTECSRIPVVLNVNHIKIKRFPFFPPFFVLASVLPVNLDLRVVMGPNFIDDTMTVPDAKAGTP